MRALTVLLLLWLPYLFQAQNLVPNPGFEEYIENPGDLVAGVNESIHWFHLGSTTDFFHRNHPSISGIPQNFRGYQEPASGDGCAGIIAAKGPGEFLAVQLTQTLESGVLYDVSFKVNLSNACQFSSDDIGMAFTSQNPLDLDLDPQKDIPYQIKNKEGEFITDTVGWTTIESRYLAKGDENFLLIGNFYRDFDTSFKKVNTNEFANWVYFYIDDVVVQFCSDPAFEPVPVDTAICEGTSIRLSGFPDAVGYYWEGIDATQSIEVESAGTYVVNNFFECSVVQQVFNLSTADCNCSINIPSVQLATDQLRLATSLNVLSYQLYFFDASGKQFASTNDIDLEKLRMPNQSGIYFWQAQLTCLGLNDMPFSQIMGGKVIIKN